MSDEILKQDCQCPCGHTKFTIQGKPISRAFCHCTICQEFNHAAYADVTIFLSKDVLLHDEKCVNFSAYKKPPAVQRGKCSKCDKPAIERFDLPLLPSLTIIPSGNIPAGPFLPESSAHIFYHRRLADISDELPKYSGFLKSQVVFNAKLMPNLFRRLVGW
jgi:hypothetical protein